MCGEGGVLPQGPFLLGPEVTPHSVPHHRGGELGVTLKQKALLPLTRHWSSRLGVPIPVASEGLGREKTDVIVTGRGRAGLGGTEAQRQAPTRGFLSRGCSRHLGGRGLESTAWTDQFGGHLSGCLPPFSCERQAGHDMGDGGGLPSAPGKAVLRAMCPMTRVESLAGAEGQGEGN